MRSKRLLVIASAFTIIMAVPHFFVPFIFPWGTLTEGLYAPIKWALFAMNFFFSLLLLWGGLLSLIVTIKLEINKSLQNWIYGGIGTFWFIGAIYEILNPFPIVEARYVLPFFALIISLLYTIALVKLKRERM